MTDDNDTIRSADARLAMDGPVKMGGPEGEYAWIAENLRLWAATPPGGRQTIDDEIILAWSDTSREAADAIDALTRAKAALPWLIDAQANKIGFLEQDLDEVRRMLRNIVTLFEGDIQRGAPALLNEARALLANRGA